MMTKVYSRGTSFLICLITYIFAFIAAYITVAFSEGTYNTLITALLADIVATVVVYLFSVYFKNASLYDAYWSVAPPVIAIYWFQHGTLGFFQLMIIVAISIWAIRLTWNWAKGWSGLQHQDWRYTQLQQQNPKTYWLVNLTGIHLFPTIIVFLGMLPVCYSMQQPDTVVSSIFWIGFAICVVATAIEYLADEEMRFFKRYAKPGSYIDKGLWKYSRHPNYFGEICFWLGLWVMQLALTFEPWYSVVGVILMILLFVFISIPLMEKKNLKSKPGYNKYIIEVSMLVPWFRKKV
jgi:steroid 5-alpha reductase family enzyme